MWSSNVYFKDSTQHKIRHINCRLIFAVPIFITATLLLLDDRDVASVE